MRITQGMMTDNMMRNLQHNMKRLDKYNQQLSSGKKFRFPSEAPIEAARSMDFSASIARSEQHEKNIDQAHSWMQTTETALDDSNNVIQRGRELTIQGANDTLTADERQKLANEMIELRNELISISETQHGDRNVFSGQKTDEKPFDAEGNYHGDFKNINRELGPGIEMAINVNGQEAFGKAIDALDDVISDLQGGNARILTGELESGPLGAHIPEGNSMEIEFEGEAVSIVEGDLATFAVQDTVEENIAEVELEEGEAYSIEELAETVDLADAHDGNDLEANYAARNDDNEIVAVSEDGSEWLFVAEGEAVENLSQLADNTILADHAVDFDPDNTGQRVIDGSIEVSEVDGDASYTLAATALTDEVVTERLDDGSYTAVEIDDGNYEDYFGPDALDPAGDNWEHDNIDSILLDADGSVIAIESEAADDGAAGAHEYYHIDDFDLNADLTESGDNGGALDTSEVDPVLRTDLDDGAEVEVKSSTIENLENMNRSEFVRELNDEINRQLDTDNEKYVKLRNNRIEFRSLEDGDDSELNISFLDAGGEEVELDAMAEDHLGSLLFEGSDYEPGETRDGAEGRMRLSESDIEAFDEAVDDNLTVRSELGAKMNRLEMMEGRLEDNIINLRSLRSENEDVDIAKAVMEMRMEESVYQASLATGARVMQPTLVDFLQ